MSSWADGASSIASSIGRVQWLQLWMHVWVCPCSLTPPGCLLRLLWFDAGSPCLSSSRAAGGCTGTTRPWAQPAGSRSASASAAPAAVALQWLLIRKRVAVDIAKEEQEAAARAAAEAALADVEFGRQLEGGCGGKGAGRGVRLQLERGRQLACITQLASILPMCLLHGCCVPSAGAHDELISDVIGKGDPLAFGFSVEGSDPSNAGIRHLGYGSPFGSGSMAAASAAAGLMTAGGSSSGSGGGSPTARVAGSALPAGPPGAGTSAAGATAAAGGIEMQRRQRQQQQQQQQRQQRRTPAALAKFRQSRLWSAVTHGANFNIHEVWLGCTGFAGLLLVLSSWQLLREGQHRERSWR